VRAVRVSESTPVPVVSLIPSGMNRLYYGDNIFDRFASFLPGAFGLFFRGDDSFDARTSSSTSAFGTAINFRITSLK
jgi:hypothetical protein